MKNILVVALVAFISLFAGYSLRPTAVPDADAGKYQELKAKLEKLGQVDIEEYLRLKDQKSRYEKADEIMGKILMLMLYDLGIRGTDQQLAKFKERVTPPDGPPSAGGPVDTQAPPAADNASAAARAARPKNAPPAPVAKSDWKANGEKVKEIYRADQVEDFLKSVEIPDFFGALRGGTAITEGQLEMIEGTFTGRALFEDPKEAPWNVFMSVNGEMQDGQPFGEFTVTLSKNGKQFSRVRSGRKRGEKNPIKSDNFMGIDGDPNSVIINAYGDDGYFQLYYFPRINEFHGLVYLKKSLGVFERKGVVHLTKR